MLATLEAREGLKKKRRNKKICGRFSARFLRQPTYEIVTIKLHDSEASENERYTTGGHSKIDLFTFYFIKSLISLVSSLVELNFSKES